MLWRRAARVFPWIVSSGNNRRNLGLMPTGLPCYAALILSFTWRVEPMCCVGGEPMRRKFVTALTPRERGLLPAKRRERVSVILFF